MTSQWLCAVSDMPLGTVKGFTVQDDAQKLHAIALAHTETDQWFAVQDQCSHGRVKLSDGFLSDETIECPRHGAVFALETGVPESLPAVKAIATYPIHVAADGVYIELNS